MREAINERQLKKKDSFRKYFCEISAHQRRQNDAEEFIHSLWSHRK